jgi:predicted protein tyrosine phosphatase
MEIIVHPTIQTTEEEIVHLAYQEDDKTIFLGNAVSCKSHHYNTIISIVDPDNTQFCKIQDSHYILSIYDHSTENIQPIFEAFLSILTKCKGTILVHCGEGISRSPALLLGYRMYTKHIPFQEAFRELQNNCPRIKPNRGFIKFLNKSFPNPS